MSVTTKSPRRTAAPRAGRRRGRERRPAFAAAAGLLTVAMIVGFIVLVEQAYNGVPVLSYRTVYASLPNIGHLQQHDPVDMAGVRVGQVLRTKTRSNRALVELQLRGVGPLPADTKAVVRAKGLLGERYIELVPGRSSQMLPDKATITGDANTYTWGVPEALNLFDPQTRTALGHMTRGLGQGLAGLGSQLNETIRVAPGSGRNFDVGVAAILARPDAASSFIPSLNGGFAALDNTGDALTDMFRPAADALQPLVTQRKAVTDTVSRFPSLEGALVGLGRSGPQLWGSVGQLSAAVEAVAPTAIRGMRSTVALLKGAPAPLRQTTPALDAVPAGSRAGLGTLRAMGPNLPRLRELFTTARPLVKNLGQHGCDFQSLVSGVHSLTNWGTLPGGPLGPNVGFGVGLVISPQEGNTIEGYGADAFPDHELYPAPCTYSPGPTIPQSTLLQIMAGAVRPQK